MAGGALSCAAPTSTSGKTRGAFRTERAITFGITSNVSAAAWQLRYNANLVKLSEQADRR
jgi:hypothetical protein